MLLSGIPHKNSKNLERGKLVKSLFEDNQVHTRKVNLNKISQFLKCSKCGGNGYTKSSADCYRTCLSCFGKGFYDQK